VIVSYEHGFVFLKTRKTAGTSVEIALSRVCGDDDVIGPISPADEELRVREGGRGAQHDEGVQPHMRARAVRRLVGQERWGSMVKLAVERNPWDAVVSQYFWVMSSWESRGIERIPFREFVLEQPHPERLAEKNARVYRIAGRVVVDRMLRYESLTDDLAAVWTELGLPSEPRLPHAKGGTRTDRRHYREIHDDDTRARVAELFADAIDEFGYEF
jgi:hypothetical protein